LIAVKPISTNSFIIETGDVSLTIYETSEGQIEILPTQKYKTYEKIVLQIDHDGGKEKGLHDQNLDNVFGDRIRILGLVLQNSQNVTERREP